jgi:hypothetical protein
MTDNQIVAAGYTQATIEARIAYIERGHESFFTDDEARQVLPGLSPRFVNVTVVRECPHRGYTRISAHNVVFTTRENGVRFVGDPL